jgi:hypothetical protein
MNVKLVVAILLLPVVPVCAQAQSPSPPKVNKGDAQRAGLLIGNEFYFFGATDPTPYL